MPASQQALERGKYLFESRGCVDCHGANGGGREFVNDGKGLRIAGANITPGGVTAGYQPEDWVRAIRHGVKPGGRPLMVMPSEDYNRFTDQDLAALVSYVRSLPPQQRRRRRGRVPGAGAHPLRLRRHQDAAAKIDHSLPPAQPVPEAVNAQHGAYVANMCIGCHGEHLSGGKIPGGPPDWPPAANITPGDGSAMTRYKDAGQFIAMLRSGKRPGRDADQGDAVRVALEAERRRLAGAVRVPEDRAAQESGRTVGRSAFRRSRAAGCSGPPC